MSRLIMFAIAATAGAAEVAELISDVNRYFGTNTSGTISPTSISTDNAAPSAPANTAAPTGELDKNGMPWDERIHSSSKAKNEDATWRYKRGVDAATKTRIENEIKATLAATGAPVTGAAAPAAPAVAAAVPVPGVPAPPAVPGAPALPAIPAAPVNPAYTAFVDYVTANMQAAGGRLTDDWVKQVLTHYGIADGSLQNLALRPDLIPTIEAYIRQALG